MKKSGLAFILLFLVSSIVFGAGGDLGAGAGADGSEAAPWLIEDFADFEAFCGDSCKWSSGVYTKLEADIDLNPNDPNLAGREIYSQAPITGDEDSTNWDFDGTTYSGIFDGNGHVVSNLTIEGNSYLGLFGVIEGVNAEVINLRLVDVTIICGDDSEYVGALCGSNGDWDLGGKIENCSTSGVIRGSYGAYGFGGICGYSFEGGVITNCHSSCTVTGETDSVCLGGLCGDNFEGRIENCHATGQITGGDDSSYLGGLCGCNEGGEIIYSYATGNISGGYQSSGLGGLCGESSSFWYFSEPKTATIINCYSEGSVTGDSCLGGLVGINNQGVIKDSYSTGSVTAKGNSECIGGLCGASYNEGGFITDCYSSGQVYGGISSGRIGGLCGIVEYCTLTNCTASGAVNGNDNVWQLGGLCGSIEYSTVTNCSASGNVSAGDAGSSSIGGFCGSNDKSIITDCFAIGSVIVGIDASHLGGLSGENRNESTITNCYASGSVTGNNYSFMLGGLCGNNDSDCTVNSCYAKSDVQGGKYSGSIGGLCAENQGTITDSYATGLVSSGEESENIGGLCGQNQNGNIANCYASGSVTVASNSYSIGGLCGYNGEKITNCYSTGSVTGTHKVGGLCGFNEGSITNCYTTGYYSGIIAPEYSIGGLVGQSIENKIVSCFWDVETSGIGLSNDDNFGATGKATAEMQDQATYAAAGWDFIGEQYDGVEDNWRMPYEMPGYPILAWEKDIPGDVAGGYGVDMEDAALLSRGWMETYQIADLEELAENWLAGK